MEGESPEARASFIQGNLHVASGDLTSSFWPGILHRRHARLHRAGNLLTKGLRKRVRLVVTGRDHVRVLGRLSAVLFGVDTRHVPEDHPLATIPHVPRRRAPQPRSRGSH